MADVTIVQVKAGLTNSGGATATASFDSAAGTGIIAGVVVWAQNTRTLSSITDDKGNTYTIGTDTNASDVHSCPFYVLVPITGVVLVTATFSGTCQARVSLMECTTGIFANQVGATGSSTTPSAGSYVASAGSAALTGSIVQDGVGSPPQYTVGGGWTILMNDGGGSWEEGSQYRLASGSITGDMTVANTGPWSNSMITFSPSGSTGVRIPVGT